MKLKLHELCDIPIVWKETVGLRLTVRIKNKIFPKAFFFLGTRLKWWASIKLMWTGLMIFLWKWMICTYQILVKGDFDIAYCAVMGTGLDAYLRKFLVFQPGVWLCQFYGRQIIHQLLSSWKLKRSQGTWQYFTWSLFIFFPMKFGKNFQKLYW